MIYNLACGGCHVTNPVSGAGTSTAITWECDCGNINVTSLPVEVDNTLVTDSAKADALLSSDELQALNETPIQSKPAEMVEAE